MNHIDIVLLMTGVALMGIAIIGYFGTIDTLYIGNIVLKSGFQIATMFALGFALAARSIVRDIGDGI